MASNSNVSYPFDGTGLAATNLIINEQHQVQSFNYQNFYLIVPDFAPFFTNNFVLQYSDPSTPLKNLIEGQDFQFVFPYWGATRSIGAPIYGGVLILDTTLTGTCQLQYQTMGGPWVANVEYVLTQITQQIYNPRSVIWDVLTNVQQIFPPINHDLSIDNTYGVQSLLDELTSMASAIANKPQPTFRIEGPSGPTGPQGGIGPVGPQGPAGRDANAVTLSGPASVYAGSTSVYTITNYNYATNYTATVTAGTIRVSGTQVTFNAPAFASNVTMTIAGVNFPVIVTIENIVATPSIVSPVDASVGLGSTVKITSSAFAMSSGADTQQSASWQLATDSSFTTIISQSLNDTVNLTSWTVSSLTVNTLYYVRVLYTGNLLESSSYSTPSTFTTKASFTPTAVTSQFTSSVASGDFGYSVSLSSDGTLALVGAYGEGSNTGAAYIYQNVSGTWTQIIRLASGVSGSYFGYAVALSADGSTALVGAYAENSEAGAAYLYQIVSGTWTQIIRMATGVTTGWFGSSVALNSTGAIAAVGAYQENTNTGAVYIYTDNAGTWSSPVQVTNGVAASQFGNEIALSADGTILLAGAFGENGSTTSAGAAYVYRNSAGTWTQVIRLASEVTGGYFGISVALSSDGTIALIGGYGENTKTGAAYFYQNTAGTWTRIARVTSGVGSSNFGWSVALTADGTIALIGADTENTNNGAVYVYQNQAGTWTQTIRLASSATAGYFGYSVSLSGDASTAAIGAYQDNTSTGTVYIAT